MWTGQQTLSNVNQALSEAKREFADIDNQLSVTTSRLTQNQHEQATQYKALAQQRLNDIQRNHMVESLNTADKMALEYLANRTSAIESLSDKINYQQRAIEQLEQERSQAAQSLESLGETLLSLEEKSQQQLDQDTQYQTQFNAAQKADQTADFAEEKSQLAIKDREEKSAPYEQDTFFMYLWNRGYGTAKYTQSKPNPLIRYGDNFVAKLCGYEKSRVNYWTLNEIPKRMKLHAENIRKISNNELEKCHEIEHAIAQSMGVTGQQSALDQQQKIVDDFDEKLDQQETTLHNLLANKSTYISGDDEYYKKAITLLSNVFAQQELEHLRFTAEHSDSIDDDLAVANLNDLVREKSELQQQLDIYRQRQSYHLKKLKDLERVKTNFKQHRFDDLRSSFANESLIQVALKEFMRGALNQSDLWNTILRHQRHRNTGALPDYGSGGLGRGSRQKSPWHWPKSRGSGRKFRLPNMGGSQSRGRKRGGFKTGGGF